MGFPKRKKIKVVDDNKLRKIVDQKLGGYVSREEFNEHLSKIDEEKRKKMLWDALPSHKKLKVLRFVAQKKGEVDG